MKLPTTIFAAAIVLVLAGLSGVLVYQNGKRAGEADVRAELHATYLTRVDSLNTHWLDSLNTLTASYQHAARVDTVMRTRYRTAVDTLRITDTVQVRAALSACDEALGACDSTKVVLLSRVALERQRADTLSAALTSTRQAWETELTRRRGLFHTLKIGLPYAAAGVLVGLLIN